MKRLLIAFVMLMLLANVVHAEEAKELENTAVEGLYKVSVDIADYGDGINPKLAGKWTEESKTILDRKIKYYEASLTGLKAITDDPAYKQNPENLDFKDTYNKAVTAVQRLDSQIAELKQFQNQQMNEDGEVEDSGFLGFFKKSYDNENLKTKLQPTDGGKDKDSGFLGISWWIWAIIILALLYVARNQIKKPFTKFKGKRASEDSKDILTEDKNLGETLDKMAATLNETAKALNGNAELPDIKEDLYADQINKWSASNTTPVKISERDKAMKKLVTDKATRGVLKNNMKTYDKHVEDIGDIIVRRDKLRQDEMTKIGAAPALTDAENKESEPPAEPAGESG